MILGGLFLLGGVALLVLAWRRIRAASGTGWVTAAETRLVIAAQPGEEVPSLFLQRGDGIGFGPVPAVWTAPPGMEGVPAPLPGSGVFRVLGAVDLAGQDLLGTGDARLDALVRGSFGPTALVLAPEQADRPILLHGLDARAPGSAGGIGIEQRHFQGLLEVLGDPAGLRVEVVRRRVQRGGWGAQRASRQRLAR